MAAASSPGLFITLEGIDGAGKSTHLAAMAEWLQAQGRELLVTREPGGTPLAETLRELVLHQGMDALTEALLVFAARRDHLQQRILPALQRGCWVLCDRFTDASFAYQGGGRGIDSGRIAELERWVAGLKPGLSFLLDLPVETGLARAGSRAAPDRIEAESMAFFERVRASYRSRAAAEPQRWCVLDASRPAEAVAAAVVQRLNIQREVSR